jgi:hypothetical protein
MQPISVCFGLRGGLEVSGIVLTTQFLTYGYFFLF